MNPNLSRRALLGVASASALTAAVPASETPAEPFRYMLNMSTIRGQNLSLPEQIDIAAKAGYNAVEPWVRDLEKWITTDKGDLKDLAKRISDRGMTCESAIGFAKWIVNDDAERKKGLEEAKRDMDWLATLGCKRMAAPPVGAQQTGGIELLRAAERYRALLELGDKHGVTPQVEVWGFSKSLNRLGETMLVAMEANHPKACLLPDVYHLYKGGSDFTGLKILGGMTMHVFHMNDYPADLSRAMIADKDRVYPGDGVAPLKEMLRTLRDIGFKGHLSLELFNPTYWKQDALLVAKTGLEKMKGVVRAALS